MSLTFELLDKDGTARRGRLQTAHGTVETPAFMPVGTAGTVKAMLPQSVAETGAQIVLGNTYHLMLRPGAEVVEALGGLGRFAGWDGLGHARTGLRAFFRRRMGNLPYRAQIAPEARKTHSACYLPHPCIYRVAGFQGRMNQDGIGPQ